MRVIAGEWRGRALAAPEGRLVRPTSDKMRGALFSILGDRVRGARFADLCAGSGAIGIEALSRGAASCLFVETSPEALRAIRANLESLGAGPERDPRVEILARDARAAIREGRLAVCEFVFADPPWDAGLGEELLRRLSEALDSDPPGLQPGVQVIVEHRRTNPAYPAHGRLLEARSVRHGEGVLSFRSAGSPPGQEPSRASD